MSEKKENKFQTRLSSEEEKVLVDETIQRIRDMGVVSNTGEALLYIVEHFRRTSELEGKSMHYRFSGELEELSKYANRIPQLFSEIITKTELEIVGIEGKSKSVQDELVRKIEKQSLVINSLEQQIERVKLENEAYLEDAEKDYKKKLSELKEKHNKEIENKDKEISELKEKLSEKERLLKKVSGQLEEVIKVKNESAEEVKVVKGQLTSKDNVIMELTRDNREMKNELKSVDEKVNQLTGTIESLKVMYEEEKEKLQNTIHKNQKEYTDSLLSILSKQQQVETERKTTDTQ